MEKSLKALLVISYLLGSPWVIYRSYSLGELNAKAIIAAAILPLGLWIGAMMMSLFVFFMWDLASDATGYKEAPGVGRLLVSILIAVLLLAIFGGGDPACIVNVRAGQC